MKALVLAAGKGSRLGASAGGLPKPLVEIGGTSPLERNLQWVAAEGPDTIWINVHEQAGLVAARAGAAVNGVRLRYSYEPDLLGTAGAWKKLEAEWTDTSLVVYGDNLMRFDLAGLLRTHCRVGAILTVALFDAARHRNTGVGGGRAALRGDRITRFVEGGVAGPINAGVYCLEPALAAELPPGFLDFGRDVLPGLARAGRLAGHVVEDGGYCLGVDTPERLALARQMADTLEVSP
jgi:mannose-1-phosphate guanylyltransferase